LILPPASSLTQYNYDLVFNAFAVRRVARLNRPIGERGEDERADWEIINGLGAAIAATGGREWTPLPPPRAAIAAGLERGGSGLDIDALEAAEHGMDLGALRPSLLSRLETPHGRIDCAPEPLLSELHRLLATEAVAARADGELRLIGRRELRSNNSWMHNAPRLVKGKPRHQLLMHPQDLAQRGLRSGGRVRISSRVGSIETDALASEDMMPGVACLPHGFGHDREGTALQRANTVVGASYNDLSDPEWLDGACGNAALNGIPIRVEPA
ncbi:MAG: molybdopterin dinucleotide binding domain-containing protein, partial [Arenimonas sp.]